MAPDGAGGAAGAAAEAASAGLTRPVLAVHLGLAGVLLLLLACHRCATVNAEPGGRIEDHDAAFHARRAERAVAGRTLLPPVVDAFESFPEGGRAVWPPLHDAMLGLALRLGGSTPEEPARGMPVAAAVPVVELLLALGAAALLAARGGGARGAAFAAWVVAATPALARRGAYGEIDHNATEVLGALLLALLAWRPLSPGSRGGGPLRAALWAGAVLLAMGFQAGLALSALFVAAAVGVAELLGEDETPARLPWLAAGFGAAALLLPVFASLRVRPDPADPWRLGPPYVLILAAGAAVLGAVSLAVARRRGTRVPPAADRIAVALALAIGLGLWALSSAAARSGLARGLGFVGSRDPWLATIEEFQPLWTVPASTMAAFLPAALVGLVAVALRLRATKSLALPPPAFAFLAFLALGLLQKRFLPLSVAFAGAAAGSLLAGAAPAATAAARVPVPLRVAFGAGLLAASPMLLDYTRQTLRSEAVPFVSAGEVAGQVLRALTPGPGDPPAWGVYAPWDFGHQILRVSSRPVVLNNFGSFHPGFAEKLRVQLEPSPAKAVAELARLRVRYVVAGYPPNVIPGAARALGEEPGRYFAGGFTVGGYPRYDTTELGARTLAVRLHLKDGAPLPGDGEDDRAALSRFRLIWSSEERAPGPGATTVPFLKVFELVQRAGAAKAEVERLRAEPAWLPKGR